MRLLHIINTLDPAFGGPVEAVRQFASRSGQGATVEVLAVGPYQPATAWNVPTHVVGKGMTRYAYSPRLTTWLENNARRFDAAVIHGVWHYHLVGAWRALRGAGVPYFVILHGMLDPWFRDQYPLKHIKKTLFWHPLVHPSLKDAEAVLFLCEEERRRAHMTFPMKLRGEPVAPLGIEAPPPDSSTAALRARFPELRGKRVIAFFGRICYMKGCDILLRAFARTLRSDPTFHLIMCGPDVEQWLSDLKKLALQLGIGAQVTFPGPVYGDEKWGVLKSAELFVLPSHCETFPVAVLEALACGTPVIISNRVGIYREVAEGGAGMICEDTEESLIDALHRWLRLDGNEREALNKAAVETFRRRFEIGVAFAHQVEVIRKFIAPHALAADSRQRVGGNVAIS